MTAIQRDASEHLVHRLLLALAAHPDGATFDQLQSDLGGVPPEALLRRLDDFLITGLAALVEPDGYILDFGWTLSDNGRARADLLGAPWPSSRSTPTAAPAAAPEPKPT